jgi:hypothetical protein
MVEVSEDTFSIEQLEEMRALLMNSAPAISPTTRLFVAQLEQHIGLIAELRRYKAETEFHPRAVKLMRKHKNFVVVAENEPYFTQVYDLIRESEQKKNRWTDEDEYHYQVATGKWQP